MPPKGRRRIGDLGGELLVGALDVLPKVKAGNVCAPAALARVGGVSEDRGEVEQRVSPAPDRLGRRSPHKLLRAVGARLFGRAGREGPIEAIAD